jgi:hypothetical protein
MVRTVVERKRGKGRTGRVVSRTKATGDDSVGLGRKRSWRFGEPEVPARDAECLGRDEVHEDGFG